MKRRNIKTRRSKQSFKLPNELIEEEILSRLPVESLLRFRCVSKSWLSLIDSKQFIKTHFQNSTKNSSLSHHGLVFPSNGRVNLFSLLYLLNEPSIVPSSPINDPPRDKAKRYCVVGSCNGLVCLLRLPDTFILWNPATKTSVELPRLREYITKKFGFGWDETSGAYKVFVRTINGGAVGKVYNSSTNKWTIVKDGDGASDWSASGNGQFVGGRIHWRKMDYLWRSESFCIENFDLETEKFGTIELPYARKDSYYFWLGDIRGCLSILAYIDFRDVVDVWVMNEYGVKESWSKFVTIPHVYVPTIDSFKPIFGGGPNGGILIAYGDTLVVYNPNDDDAFSIIKKSFQFYQGFVYVESLVSPVVNNQLSSRLALY